MVSDHGVHGLPLIPVVLGTPTGSKEILFTFNIQTSLLAFIINIKSTVGRYRPVRVADGPIAARCRFIKNAYRDLTSLPYFFKFFANSKHTQLIVLGLTGQLFLLLVNMYLTTKASHLSHFPSTP